MRESQHAICHVVLLGDLQDISVAFGIDIRVSNVVGFKFTEIGKFFFYEILKKTIHTTFKIQS